MLLVAILVFCGTVGFFVFLTDSFFGGLDFSTSQLAADGVIKIIKDRHLENGNFYDLGSCRGNFARKIASALPLLKVLGIDNNRLRTIYSKISAQFLQNLHFETADIFTSDISNADIVYLYLPKELLPELKIKLKKELKLGSLIITHSVSFPEWTATEIVNLPKDKALIKKLFVYVK